MSQLVTVEAADTSRLSYLGRWAVGSDSYNRQMQWTANNGDMVTLRFKGTSIRIYAGHPGGDFGFADCWVHTGVTLDAEPREPVHWKCGQTDDVDALKVYDRSGLEDREHTVRLFYWTPSPPMRLYSMEYEGAPSTRTPALPPTSPPATAPPPSSTQSEPSPTTQRTDTTTLPLTSESTSSQSPSSTVTHPVTNRLDTSLVAPTISITSEQSDTFQAEPSATRQLNAQVHTRASDAQGSLGTDSVGGQASESGSPGLSANRVPVIVGSTLGALFVLVTAILLTVCLVKRRYRRTGGKAEFEDKGDVSGAADSTAQLINANLSASHFSADTTPNRSVDKIDSSNNASGLSSALTHGIRPLRKEGAPVPVPCHWHDHFIDPPTDSTANVEMVSLHSARNPPTYQSGNYLVA